jgi:hypothetical protein
VALKLLTLYNKKKLKTGGGIIMKLRLLKILIVTFFMLCFAVPSVYSNTYTFIPSPQDLYDLDHSYYYEWGKDWSLPGGETITSVSISFINIYDWTYENNDTLYVNLLNTASSGVVVYYDGESGGNNFPRYIGQLSVEIGTWNDPNGDYAHRTTQTFNVPEAYYGWLSDGNFGFGIDPDCHYYNEGVVVTIETSTVPEPSTLLLLGLGLLGTAALRRKRQ